MICGVSHHANDLRFLVEQTEIRLLVGGEETGNEAAVIKESVLVAAETAENNLAQRRGPWYIVGWNRNACVNRAVGGLVTLDAGVGVVDNLLNVC